MGPSKSIFDLVLLCCYSNFSLAALFVVIINSLATY